MSIEQNERIFALMSLRLALMIVYFLIMNSKRHSWGVSLAIKKTDAKNVVLDSD